MLGTGGYIDQQPIEAAIGRVDAALSALSRAKVAAGETTVQT